MGIRETRNLNQEVDTETARLNALLGVKNAQIATGLKPGCSAKEPT